MILGRSDKNAIVAIANSPKHSTLSNVLVYPHKIEISGVPAFHVAAVDNKTRVDQYLLQRERSTVIIVCTTPENATAAELQEMRSVIEAMPIDPTADKLLVQ